MRWKDYAATLDPLERADLLAALADGGIAARRASRVLATNGEVGQAIRHIDLALADLCLARALLVAGRGIAAEQRARRASPGRARSRAKRLALQP